MQEGVPVKEDDSLDLVPSIPPNSLSISSQAMDKCKTLSVAGASYDVCQTNYVVPPLDGTKVSCDIYPIFCSHSSVSIKEMKEIL